MQAFLATLDIDYAGMFTCQHCLNSGATLIIDGKEMGINRSLFKPYTPPTAPAAPTVAITWCVNLPVLQHCICQAVQWYASYHCDIDCHYILMCSPHDQIVPIPDAKIRDLVAQFAKGCLPEGDWQQLLRLCSAALPELEAVLESVGR